MIKIAEFIHTFCAQEELPALDKTAVAKVMEYSSRLADNQEKLSTRFNDLSQIVAEAATWAKMDKSKIVSGEYVDKALQERIERIKKYDSRYLEMIKDNTLLINTKFFFPSTENPEVLLKKYEFVIYSFSTAATVSCNGITLGTLFLGGEI